VCPMLVAREPFVKPAREKFWIPRARNLVSLRECHLLQTPTCTISTRDVDGRPATRNAEDLLTVGFS
jgi:hypothetical protein